MKRLLINVFFLTLVASLPVINCDDTIKYEPNWDSLDTRPLPQWYDDAKFGIFLHWGVFSVPSFGSEWFWSLWDQKNEAYVDFIENNYPKGFSYQEFAKDFTAEFFNPDDWAELFANSGAKYVVLTSKHHEGYTLWPSKYSFSWNAKDIGPHRDLVGDLADAVRAKNLTFGLYHSLFEWFNPMYVADKQTNYVNREFVDNKVLPELYELVNNYKPDIIWSDGDWEAPDTYWNSTGFIAWLYNESPVKDTVIVNDRWGIGITCNHGDVLTCSDRYNPGTLQSHKWENAMTIDKASWGYRRNAKLDDYYNTRDLLLSLVETVSCGGNLLLNVGPTKDGIIAPIFEERLTEIGTWLGINGEAIYKSQPWTAQNDTLTWGVWYTQRDGSVYASFFQWPYWSGTLLLESAVTLVESNATTISLLGNDGNLKWSVENNTVSVVLPDFATVVGKDGWVLKFSNFS